MTVFNILYGIGMLLLLVGFIYWLACRDSGRSTQLPTDNTP